MVNITLKNYRCFSDTKPATVEIGPRFTAFVGPNNSGKSSFPKFFYEFQQFWGYLNNVANLANKRSHLAGEGLTLPLTKGETIAPFGNPIMLFSPQKAELTENQKMLRWLGVNLKTGAWLG